MCYYGGSIDPDTGDVTGPKMGGLIQREGGTNMWLDMYDIPADRQVGSDAWQARQDAWKQFKSSATDAQLSGDWSNFSGAGGGIGSTPPEDPNVKSNLQTKKAPKPTQKKKKPPTTGGGGLQVPDSGMSAGTGGLNV